MKYPIGIQSFKNIRTGGYVYVDKTALIYQMADRGQYYFFSRPRRFGKSLLVSTMEAYFQGKKELFGGLAIKRLETEWQQYPVLHLDLNVDAYNTPENLEQVLNKVLSDWERIYGSNPDETTLALRFAGIIRRAYEKSGKSVVVLVDEYDKPLLSVLNNQSLYHSYLNTLKGFFGVLKTQDLYLRFVFITGVSRFSHVSIFSDLNNLKDISMSLKYAALCGITERELYDNFGESIRELAFAEGISYEETCDKLRRQYDGYHFCENGVGVYNPFSLLNTFDENKFSDYWFRSGTPTFLVKVLQQNNYDLSDIEGKKASEAALSSTYTDKISPVALLYQTGYLTIKGYDKEYRLYTLGFPNEEVERGFVASLVPHYTHVSFDDNEVFFVQLAKEVKQGKPDEFMRRVQTLLSDNDYRVAGNAELYFQNTLSLIFKMLSFNVQVERATSQGRMDVTIQTKDYIYIFELKLDGTAEEALQQIKDNQYARPFQTDGRKLYKIGVNFSSKTRTVEKWVIE